MVLLTDIDRIRTIVRATATHGMRCSWTIASLDKQSITRGTAGMN